VHCTGGGIAEQILGGGGLKGLVQDEQWMHWKKRKTHATFLSTHYLNAECVQTHFCSCDVSRIDTPRFHSPTPPTEPAIKCEIYQVGVDQPSFEAFRKWENNRDLIQCGDWEHRTAVTDWLISKPNIGTGGLCTNSLTALQYCEAFRSFADCIEKSFCWCAVTREFTRSSKIASNLSLLILSQRRVRTNTFLFLWCQQGWNPKLSVYGFHSPPSEPAIKCEIY